MPPAPVDVGARGGNPRADRLPRVIIDIPVHYGKFTGMARTKEFDRGKALETAEKVFRRGGYANTTTEDLRLAMGIGRQSFYDTFQGKHEVFVESLRKYNSGRGHRMLALIQTHADPLEALESALVDIANESTEDRALQCLGGSSTIEFGTTDEVIRSINDQAGKFFDALFVDLIKKAIAAKELRPSLDEKTTSQYIQTLLSGLRVAALGGARSKDLGEVARIAIEGLKR